MSLSRKSILCLPLTLAALILFIGKPIANASEPAYDAAMVLGESGFDTSFENLSATLSDENAHIITRQLTALALGQSGNPRALEILSRELVNADIEMRAAVLRGISEMSDSRAISTLESVLTGDESATIRQLAASVLQKLGTEDSYSAIERGLQTVYQDEAVKISIIEILRSNPSFDSKMSLSKLLIDGSSEVRARAAVALSERGQLQSEQILIDAATKYDIPHHVWASVVARLEETSGSKFRARGRTNHFRIDANDKHEINTEISRWWSATKSKEQQ